jgi:hypothetical protein
MKKILTIITAAFFIINVNAQDKVPSNEDQINSALQAAPKEKRAEATVLGFNDKGDVIVLKKGSNELICLADYPFDKSFSVACYHKDLDPFMARGRALKKEGKTPQEKFEIREKEAKDGSLKMPKQPTTLYLLYGNKAQYDPKTKTVLNGTYRWVVYIPWATPESSGLPTYPMVPGGPWIMNPGTHKAHIMVSPITCQDSH